MADVFTELSKVDMLIHTYAAEQFAAHAESASNMDIKAELLLEAEYHKRMSDHKKLRSKRYKTAWQRSTISKISRADTLKSIKQKLEAEELLAELEPVDE